MFFWFSMLVLCAVIATLTALMHAFRICEQAIELIDEMTDRD